MTFHRSNARDGLHVHSELNLATALSPDIDEDAKLPVILYLSSIKSPLGGETGAGLSATIENVNTNNNVVLNNTVNYGGRDSGMRVVAGKL